MLGVFTGELAPTVGGLAETQALRALQESDAVSPFTTAEAVPQTFSGIHRKTRSVVLVEGTAGFVGLAFAFEGVALGLEEI